MRSFTKDKITCLKTQLFMLEKATTPINIRFTKEDVDSLTSL
ncbi:hypothetical protein [Leptotrichia sp. oral taxon 879]|nr:hypothetical protein [Leptotrichia sp. oral taxon 879]ERK52109.1 hypothetical protein HMPREF1552_00832 [Leptotrichia sp. oral taxon 879 str. F0557]